MRVTGVVCFPRSWCFAVTVMLVRIGMILSDGVIMINIGVIAISFLMIIGIICIVTVVIVFIIFT